jgi:hypothetical protein
MNAIGKRQQRREDLRACWAELLPLIGSGQSLPQAIKSLPPPRPTIWALRRALQTDPELEAQYREACEIRADHLADELVAVASEEIPPELRGADASAWVQRQRLRVDVLRWTASKLRPRAWGDAVAVAVEVTQQISITAALAAAEQRVALLQREPEGDDHLLADGGGSRARSGAIPEDRPEGPRTGKAYLQGPRSEPQ